MLEEGGLEGWRAATEVAAASPKVGVDFGAEEGKGVRGGVAGDGSALPVCARLGAPRQVSVEALSSPAPIPCTPPFPAMFNVTLLTSGSPAPEAGLGSRTLAPRPSPPPSGNGRTCRWTSCEHAREGDGGGDSAARRGDEHRGDSGRVSREIKNYKVLKGWS